MTSSIADMRHSNVVCGKRLVAFQSKHTHIVYVQNIQQPNHSLRLTIVKQFTKTLKQHASTIYLGQKLHVKVETSIS